MSVYEDAHNSLTVQQRPLATNQSWLQQTPYTERHCADTIGTVLVPCLQVIYTWKQFYQTSLGHFFGLKLPKC